MAKRVRITYPKISETFTFKGDEKKVFKEVKDNPEKLGEFLDFYVSDMERGYPIIEVIDDKGKVVENLDVLY